MTVGARQLAQHERVKPVRLAARDPEPGTGRSDLVGMQRQYPQPHVQQPLDQHPVRALDRHQLDAVAHERAAQRPQPGLVVRERARQQPLARLVADQHVVLLRRPVDARVITTFHRYSSWSGLHSAPTTRYRCGRSLTGPQRGLRPVAARGTSPPPGGAGLMLALCTGKHARPSPGGGRGRRDQHDRANHRMTNEHAPAVFRVSPGWGRPACCVIQVMSTPDAPGRGGASWPAVPNHSLGSPLGPNTYSGAHGGPNGALEPRKPSSA